MLLLNLTLKFHFQAKKHLFKKLCKVVLSIKIISTWKYAILPQILTPLYHCDITFLLPSTSPSASLPLIPPPISNGLQVTLFNTTIK